MKIFTLSPLMSFRNSLAQRNGIPPLLSLSGMPFSFDTASKEFHSLYRFALPNVID
jgi:hypothetical protein